jgi:hypothetical protein
MVQCFIITVSFYEFFSFFAFLHFLCKIAHYSVKKFVFVKFFFVEFGDFKF